VEILTEFFALGFIVGAILGSLVTWLVL